jgi:hypothetical protein
MENLVYMPTRKTTPLAMPKNKLQAAAFKLGMTTEYKFRERLSKKLSISQSTLRTMWVDADAKKHLYQNVKDVADFLGGSIEDLFLT